MPINESLRRSIFWSLDFLKGRPIRRHYNEVKYLLNHPSSENARKIRKDNLQTLFKHATLTTVFYKSFKGKKKLSDFPIISKEMIRENFSDFESSSFKDKKRHLATTSGSTGYPFKLWFDKNKKNRNTADTIVFSELANYELGMNLVYLKLWVEKNHKNKLTLLKENILKHDVMDYNSKDLNYLLNQMSKNNSPKIVLGYSSFLEYLCNYMADADIDIEQANIKSIISIAEALSDKGKACLKQRFNANVYCRYSNQENGILAQQTNLSPDHYLSNSASYIIEFLHPEKDEPAPLGSWGRIVITDLFNYAMPIIRYDTGDLAIAEELNEDSGYKFKDVLGRKFDMIFDTRGEYVIPHTFLNIEDYSDCTQFQFIQDGEKDYRFKINGVKSKTDEKAATEYFKDLLGQDANIVYDYVTEIPQLSSGKHQKVVSNYRRN